MKINMNQFNEYLGQMANNDIGVRQRAVCGLAKYSSAEWQGTPDAVSSAVPALVKASRLGGASEEQRFINVLRSLRFGNAVAPVPTRPKRPRSRQFPGTPGP